MFSRLSHSLVGFLLFLGSVALTAQDSAQWITVGGADGKPVEAAVSHYRLHLTLPKVPQEFVVRVSADATYRLFVNGQPIAAGPTSGDPKKWRYDRVDLAPRLKAGKNIVAAVVWSPVNDWKRPLCLMGKGAGFYLAGETDATVNTGTAAWLTLANRAYAPEKGEKVAGYYALGDFEKVDGNAYPWGWETAEFQDESWTKASISAVDYGLIPRDIPPLERKEDRLQKIRQSEGVKLTDAFLAGSAPVTIPAQAKVTILCDRGILTNAYPELVVSGGKGAVIDVGYAESLYESGKDKGDRNQVDQKRFIGSLDSFTLDGGENRLYRPLWHRTYRYLRLQITTRAEPLTLVDLRGEFVGYPFVERAGFDAGKAELQKMWDIGWHTLRLCAVDNFYDCPYYERLQYIGDTRIESLVSVYVSGDDRLMRKAIDLFNDSIGSEGLTASRYPSGMRQIIPTFSNWWIAMVDDYRMMNGDREFIKKMVPGIETVIARFARFTTPGGLVTFSEKDQWDFVDWAGHLSHVAQKKRGDRAPSGLISLNHTYALDRAANIMSYLGDEEKANVYRERSKHIGQAVYAACWDANKGLLADDPGKKFFSEHANILGILTDAIPLAQQQDVMRKILAGKSKMVEATLYFHFYLNRALVKTGLADQYLDTLAPWRKQMMLNLSAWAEKPEPSRSDCHAWGSSPNYEFLATVAGITPASAGFATVRIAPALGALTTVNARMPHPKGMIEARLTRAGSSGLNAHLVLPPGVTGTLVWGGKETPLNSGAQDLALP